MHGTLPHLQESKTIDLEIEEVTMGISLKTVQFNTLTYMYVILSYERL